MYLLCLLQCVAKCSNVSIKRYTRVHLPIANQLVLPIANQKTVLIGYDKLIKKGCSKDKAALQVTLQLIDTWKKADCPCLDQKLVKKKVLDLLTERSRFIPQPRESHQRKKPRKTEPSRRSARGADQTGTGSQPESQDDDVADEQQEVTEPMPGPSSVDEKRPPSRTRTSFQASPADMWNDTASKELFDIISMTKINSQEKAYTFDEEFYNDQKGPRAMKMEKKENPQYKEQVRQAEKREKNVARRKELAMGLNTSQVDESLSSDESDDVDLCDYMGESTISSTPEVMDRPATRSSSTLSGHQPIFSTVSVGTQTSPCQFDLFPKCPQKKKLKQKGSKEC